jgi:hypothetical protein
VGKAAMVETHKEPEGAHEGAPGKLLNVMTWLQDEALLGDGGGARGRQQVALRCSSSFARWRLALDRRWPTKPAVRWIAFQPRMERGENGLRRMRLQLVVGDATGR